MSDLKWKAAIAAAAVAGVGGTTYVVYRMYDWMSRKQRARAVLDSLKSRDDIFIGEQCEGKIACMLRHDSDAGRHLQVVTDFDMTLTRYKDEDGQKCDTTHGALETSDRLPDWYRIETKKLKDHYLPLEFSPTLSNEEKSGLMDKWWEQAHYKLIAAGVKASDIGIMVRKARIRYRAGVSTFLSNLSANNIPVCVVSAGVSDIIEESIKCHIGHFDNLSIVSNKLEFDESGALVAVSDPTIHSYNKAAAVARSCNFGSSGRDNILLLGDNLGDPHMVPPSADLPKGFNVLRVGFLNDPSSELSRARYKSEFDIVILGDQDFSAINKLLHCLS